MDKESIVDITRQFASKLPSYIGLRKVVLYGSWAYGQAHDDSDIDVAVIVRDIKSDYLDLLTRLYDIASDVDIRIEPVVLEDGKDASGFLEQILRLGQVVLDNSDLAH